MQKNIVISDENMNYIFFQVINRIEAKRVLDVGMFLKRTGSVSRGMMDEKISESVQLVGIDFWPEITFPVWKYIYNDVYTVEEYLKAEEGKKYDLAVLLGKLELSESIGYDEIVKKVKRQASYLLTDTLSEELQNGIQEKKIKELKVDEATFFLLDVRG